MKPDAGADRVYIAHMLESIGRVMSYTIEGETQFRKSQLIQDAVTRNLQVMAESSQRLSEASRALAPDVPWRAISGFRNIVVHDYLGLDVDVIWGVVSKELPPLKMALEAISLADDKADDTA